MRNTLSPGLRKAGFWSGRHHDLLQFGLLGREHRPLVVKRWRIGLLIAAGLQLAGPAHANDEARPSPAPESAPPAVAGLDLVHRSSSGADRVASAGLGPAFRPAATQDTAPPGKLAAAISAAGKVDLVQGGVEGSKWALLECQRGDYPGGGMGVLSLPFGRPTARTDHCWH